MSFSRLTLLLRLSLTVLFFGQLVFLGSGFSPDYYMAAPKKVADTFDERDDNESFDVGLPIVTFKDALTQHSDLVSLDLGHVSQGVPLELRATGPPIV